MKMKSFAAIIAISLTVSIIALMFGLANDWRADSTNSISFSLENVHASVSVSFGNKHGAAISANGDLYTWGSNSSGQLGNGEIGGYVDTPTKVPGISDVVSVSLGSAHSAAITANGDLYTWGCNSSTYDEYGFQYTDTPTKVPGLTDVVTVSLGYRNTAAITADGSLYTWGSTYGGVLGDGTIGEQWDFRREPLRIMENVMIPNNVRQTE